MGQDAAHFAGAVHFVTPRLNIEKMKPPTAVAVMCNVVRGLPLAVRCPGHPVPPLPPKSTSGCHSAVRTSRLPNSTKQKPLGLPFMTPTLWYRKSSLAILPKREKILMRAYLPHEGQRQGENGGKVSAFPE